MLSATLSNEMLIWLYLIFDIIARIFESTDA
jgi:hypothetical protein